MHAEIENLECRSTSSRGLVDAYVIGNAELFIVVNKNAVRDTNVPTETLELDLNEAIQHAHATWSASVMRICQRYNS